MKKLLYTIVFVSQIIHSQDKKAWTFPSVKNISDEISITYELQYDRELSEIEKLIAPYEQIVTFNNRYLYTKQFSKKTDLNYSSHYIFDYKNEISYNCTISKNLRRCVKEGFKDSNLKAISQLEFKNILGYKTDEYVVEMAGKSRKLYATKDLGLSFSPNISVEGFCLEYPFNHKKFGTGVAVAKKIDFIKAPKDLFSISDYEVFTKSEMKEFESESSANTNQNEYTLLNKPAPTIYAGTLDGDYINFKKKNGKFKVVSFTIFNSPLYKNYCLEMNLLTQNFDKEKVEFISITHESTEVVNKINKVNPLKTAIITNGEFVIQKYNISYFPVFLIIDQEGKIISYKSGVGKTTIDNLKKELLKLTSL